MDLNKLMEEIFELKQNKEKLTNQIDKLKEEVTETDKLIDNKQSELLKEMKEINTKEITSDNGNIIATLFKRENIGYNNGDIQSIIVNNLTNEFNEILNSVCKLLRANIKLGVDKKFFFKVIEFLSMYKYFCALFCLSICKISKVF